MGKLFILPFKNMTVLAVHLCIQLCALSYDLKASHGLICIKSTGRKLEQVQPIRRLFRSVDIANLADVNNLGQLKLHINYISVFGIVKETS